MKRWSVPFANLDCSELPFYDLIEDYELIEASFAQQYGIRLRRENDMSWDEYITLLSGIGGDTPLGRIVSIRSETDKERLKQFTPDEKRIRNEWRAKHRRVVTGKRQLDAAMSGFAAMFKSIAEEGSLREAVLDK